MTDEQLEEARRLHAAGLKLVELYPNSKRPVGDGWNHSPVSGVRGDAGGYGLLLAANGLCSVDVDTEDRCLAGLRRCGFDLGAIRDAGVHTSSTRPGSGGRVTFRAPAGSGLRWLKFTSKDRAVGTILELRAASPNLQDSLPGTVYHSADGSGPWVQEYAGFWTLDIAPELPDDLLRWWQRMSEDVEFLREQQFLFVGDDVQLAVSSGDGVLAFSSPYRAGYNAEHDVVDILLRHDYSEHRNGRWAPPTASGAAAVRLIQGKTDLWQSDHASDPLHGTFDAWTAHVVLDHDGDLAAAEAAAEAVGSPGLRQKLVDANRSYGTSKTASKLLGNRNAAEQGNKLFSLTDTITAAPGMLVSPAGTAAAVGTKRAAERLGPATVALGADAVSKALVKSPVLLGKYAAPLSAAASRGPQSLAVAHFLLSQQDEDYRKLSEGLAGGKEE